MSDDDVDQELLELLRQSLGISASQSDEVSSDTGRLYYFSGIVFQMLSLLCLH